MSYAKHIFPKHRYALKEFDEFKEIATSMHLGLTGHSVALIGYNKWMDNYGGDRILILLEPNGGVKRNQ